PIDLDVLILVPLLNLVAEDADVTLRDLVLRFLLPGEIRQRVAEEDDLVTLLQLDLLRGRVVVGCDGSRYGEGERDGGEGEIAEHGGDSLGGSSRHNPCAVARPAVKAPHTEPA